jgi:transposase
MSTQALYHLFHIRGYSYVETSRQGTGTVVRIQPQRGQLRCSACASHDVVCSGSVLRRLRHVPCGTWPVWLEVAVPRLLCGACGRLRQLRLSFASARVGYTRAFARFIVTLAQSMSLLAVARFLRVNWDLVKGIVKRHLHRRFGRPPLGQVRRLAIDEINLGRKIGFWTIVMDLDSGAVLYVAEGRKGAALEPFWRRLRASGARIEAVATDMAHSYIHAVRQNLPEAVLVLDRFHVVKLYKEGLDQLRRSEIRRASNERRKVLAGTRWILLKRADHLDPARGEPTRLQRALEVNQRLMVAYYLGEDLNQLWQQETRLAAESFLSDWIESAYSSGISQLQRIAKTLSRHSAQLLNWADHQISTSPLESANGRIRLLQRRAYGFRDKEFLALSIYAMHERIYA